MTMGGPDSHRTDRQLTQYRLTILVRTYDPKWQSEIFLLPGTPAVLPQPPRNFAKIVIKLQLLEIFTYLFNALRTLFEYS